MSMVYRFVPEGDGTFCVTARRLGSKKDRIIFYRATEDYLRGYICGVAEAGSALGGLDDPDNQEAFEYTFLDATGERVRV